MRLDTGLLGRSRAHLATAGETYLQHLRFALSVSAHMLVAGTACLIHALVPAWCEDQASRTVRQLHIVIRDRRRASMVLREGEAAGLLTLLVLSAGVIVLPWVLQTETLPALSLSFIAFAIPVAALGSVGGDLDEVEEEVPALDAPPQRARRSGVAGPAEVVVIGGGFSGTALALQLVRRPGVRVTLVERRGEHGRGVAYSARNTSHLLNVPAARMSADADDADGFVRWLEARGLGDGERFVPRRTYGEYLEDRLVDALADSAGRLALVAAEAVDVDHDGRRARVLLDDGRSLATDAVALALGNAAPAAPDWLPRDLPNGLFVSDPWAARIAARLDRNSTVLLLGTGLTMIDAALTLQDAEFEGRIVALSRRGLLPRAHAEAPVPHAPFEPLAEGPLSQRLRALRRRADRIGWRAVMEELRPLTQDIWQATDAEQRDRFLRHLRPWWDAHRHRAAPVVARRVNRLRETGRLEVHAGRVTGAERVGERVRVSWRPRGADAIRTVDVDRIVNCTGPNAALLESPDSLLRCLRDRGLVRPDAHGLGLEVDELGRLVGAGGDAQPALYAIGPLTRGRYWEVTAVPDIRVQAAELAQAITARIGVEAIARNG